jgi:hypothetical protein
VLTEAAHGEPWNGIGRTVSVAAPFLIVATYAIDYWRRGSRRRVSNRGRFWTASRRRRIAALGLFVVALVFRALSADPLFYALVAAAVALFVLDLVLLDKEED